MQAYKQIGGQQVAVRRSAQLALWTLAWVATLALARFGPNHLWDAHEAASWAAVAINLAAGVGWIVAHALYLRGIDELQRKINLDALAVTLGVGFVGGFSYIVAHAADLITRDANVGVFSAQLAVVYMLAIAVGHLRYR